MPIRRRLTKNFVDSLTVPESGEIWVADTVVRGFGLRLWATQGHGGAAYCIRTTDINGRVARKAFTPNSFKFVHENNVLTFRMHSRSGLVQQNGKVKASGMLHEAREWGRVEIQRMKGYLPSELEHLKAIEADHQYRQRLSALLESRTLRYLVEKVLYYGACRGWEEQYCDRLRRAFDSFDEMTKSGDLTINELKDGRLVALIEESQLGLGTLRLLRSVLKPVLWNIHDLTSLNYADLLPNERGLISRANEQDEFTNKLELSDFDEILKSVRDLPYDWRPLLCIELCFHLRAPVRKVMTARWSQFSKGYWYPYLPSERVNWHWQACRVDERELEVLTLVRQHITHEEIDTDLWFPSRRDPGLPIANVDRAWSALRRKFRLPKLSLSRCCQAYKQKRPILIPFGGKDPVFLRREEIQREVSEWDQPFRR